MMKNKTENSLPKILPGTVHAQFVRCGKPNCKCVRGELHGAYYYHFVRAGGKLRKRYLKSSEVEGIQQACHLRKQQGKEQRVNSKNTWKLIRQLNESLRETRNLYILKEQTDVGE